LKFYFKVRKSNIDGRGLFSLSRIPARRKIGELAGESISQAEARRRAKSTARIAIVELGNGRAIDASREGNDFRFINHSCTPNTFMRIFRGHVEFYALKEIGVGEELTCYYGDTHHNGELLCRCLSPDCRGYI
jgi:uncharacterized protein